MAKIHVLMSRMRALLDDAREKGLTKEQKHLDAGTVERDYWHFGYAMALADIMRSFTLLEKPSDKADEILQEVVGIARGMVDDGSILDADITWKGLGNYDSCNALMEIMQFLRDCWVGDDAEREDGVRIGTVSVYLDDECNMHLDFATRFRVNPDAIGELKDEIFGEDDAEMALGFAHAKAQESLGELEQCEESDLVIPETSIHVVPQWVLDSATYEAKRRYSNMMGTEEPDVPDQFDDTPVEGDWIMRMCNGCITLWEVARDEDMDIEDMLLIIGNMQSDVANTLIEMNGGNADGSEGDEEVGRSHE